MAGIQSPIRRESHFRLQEYSLLDQHLLGWACTPRCRHSMDDRLAETEEGQQCSSFRDAAPSALAIRRLRKYCCESPNQTWRSEVNRAMDPDYSCFLAKFEGCHEYIPVFVDFLARVRRSRALADPDASCE